MDAEKDYQIIHSVTENIEKVIVGKEQTIAYLLAAVIAEGHILLEDVPGTGKTLLAKALSRSADVSFSRIQFTPDLLPSDITGLNYYNQKEEKFVLRKGPVFTNILLADEINRATPRTQSALLECMEERQVTIDGDTYRLGAPFFVTATQNPIETSGTFPLPEAQLDRFLMQLSMGTPSKEEEVAIMNRYYSEDPLTKLKAVCSAEDICGLQQDAREVFVHPDLLAYIADISMATRKAEDVSIGVSPRGTLALLRAVRAYALVSGRSYAVPEDIKSMAVPVLAHRIIFTAGLASAHRAADLITKILSAVQVPTEEWSR